MRAWTEGTGEGLVEPCSVMMCRSAVEMLWFTLWTAVNTLLCHVLWAPLHDKATSLILLPFAWDMAYHSAAGPCGAALAGSTQSRHILILQSGSGSVTDILGDQLRSTHRHDVCDIKAVPPQEASLKRPTGLADSTIIITPGVTKTSVPENACQNYFVVLLLPNSI